MRTPLTIFISSLFILLAACENAQRHEGLVGTDSAEDARIFGEESGENRLVFARYVVGISYVTSEGRERICSGALIERDVVLTAAHCAREDKRKMKVHFTKTLENFRTTPAAMVRAVSDIKIPQRYLETVDQIPDLNPNDLAILKLSSPAPESARTMMIADQFIPKSQIGSVLAMGFGRASYNLKTKAVTGNTDLKMAVLKRADYSAEGFIETDQTNGKGACVGDSGGPAFLQRPGDGKPFIVGVFTGNNNVVIGSTSVCDGQGFFVDVSKWQDWIQENL